MAVCCVPLSDEEVVAELGDARSVLIIGCPSCPAIRYALDGDPPIVAIAITGIQSIATRDEVDRLTRLLTARNVDVESRLPRIPAHLCEVDRDRLRKASRRHQPVDAIVVLGCEAGKENVEDGFQGAKAICAMKAKGLISFPAIRKLNKLFPDHDKVSIYPFQLLAD